MKKIKILRIIARLNIGGPAIHTILLTQGLDKTRFDSLLVCGNIGKDEGDMLYYGSDRGVKPILIPELKREPDFFKDIAAIKKIYYIIKTEQPDIIHTHTAKAGALGRMAGLCYNLMKLRKNKPVKLIHTFHGHIFEGYFGKFKASIFILIERFLAIFTLKIITVSNSVKDELLASRICREDKIEVIPLGLELENFLSIPIKDEGALNIGTIGRLVPVKNNRLFLEAAAKVIAGNPGKSFRFKIIGDGELRKDLEEYSNKLGIKSRVDFLGWQRDLAGIYSGLDIVALSSLNEGTPVSLIEAMAAGRAVVATDVGGVKDLLGSETDVGIKSSDDFKVMERGIAVKSGNTAGFAGALSFVAEDNELRKILGARARDFVQTQFTKERLIKDMDSLYAKLGDM